MGAPEALVFRMAELYLGRALPAAQVRRLEPYFSQARGVIEREGIPLARWRKRVRVIERGPRLQIPSVNDGVIETVHDGLLHEKRVTQDRPSTVEGKTVSVSVDLGGGCISKKK